jgi:hypothetical protein
MLALTVLCSEFRMHVLLRAGAADRRHHWQQFLCVCTYVFITSHIFYFAKRIVPMVPTLAMEWEKYIMCKHVR